MPVTLPVMNGHDRRLNARFDLETGHLILGEVDGEPGGIADENLPSYPLTQTR